MVNAAIAAVPTESQIRETFPDIDPAEFLGTYIERAKSSLRISYRDMDWFEQVPCFQYARVGRKYAEAAGYAVDYNGSAYSFDYLKKEAAGEVPRSSLNFEQEYGNNYGRFGSVDQTYIADALATGKVTLKPLTEVTDIEREPNGQWLVRTKEIDRWGKVVEQSEVVGTQLYLNAGVLGTNKLLLRARDTGKLPDLSTEIGRGYGNNGDLMVAHALADEDPAGVDQSLMGMINLDGRDDPDKRDNFFGFRIARSLDAPYQPPYDGGTLRRVTFFTNDIAKATAFWVDALGYKVRMDTPNFGGDETPKTLKLPPGAKVHFMILEPGATGGPLIGLMAPMGASFTPLDHPIDQAPRAGDAMIVVKVKDIAKSFAVFKQNGVRVMSEPTRLTGTGGTPTVGYEGIVMSPDGSRIIVQQVDANG